MRVGGTGTALSYLDTLVIPIIENTPDEEDLREGMEDVSRSRRSAFSLFLRADRLPYLTGDEEIPRCCMLLLRPIRRSLYHPRSSNADLLASNQPAVLVRRHGTYSWGAGTSLSFPTFGFSSRPPSTLTLRSLCARNPSSTELTLLFPRSFASVNPLHLHHRRIACSPPSLPCGFTSARSLLLSDWEKAKGQAECLDYLLEVAVKMKLAGMEVEGLQQ